MHIYAILLLPQPTQAQITLAPDDLRLPLSLSWASEVFTVVNT